MAKFKRRKGYVEAAELKPGGEAVLALMEGKGFKGYLFQVDRTRWVVITPAGYRITLYMGWWLVKDEDGDYHSEHPTEFHNEFEEIK